MEKLFSQINVRLFIYTHAYHCYKFSQSTQYGMCHYIEEAAIQYLQLHNIHKMDINWEYTKLLNYLPEILKYKPNVELSTGYWFNPGNRYIREKIFEDAIRIVGGEMGKFGKQGR